MKILRFTACLLLLVSIMTLSVCGRAPVCKDVVGHWSEPFVAESIDKGLFKGDSNGNFNPDVNITRAQFITVLWRMAKSPEVSETPSFEDITNQIPEFKKAIAWGYAKGYINGTSKTTFAPNESLTREAAMKILHAYSGGKIGQETVFYAIYDGTFSDSGEISQWAKSSVYWGIYNKLISGTSSETLSPKKSTTRAQVAKILVNYISEF